MSDPRPVRSVRLASARSAPPSPQPRSSQDDAHVRTSCDTSDSRHTTSCAPRQHQPTTRSSQRRRAQTRLASSRQEIRTASARQQPSGSSTHHQTRSSSARSQPKTRPLRRSARRICLKAIPLTLVALIICGFAGINRAGTIPAAESEQLDLAVLTADEAPNSTPQSQWQTGKMPHLYQRDFSWAQKSYGGGTIAENACGPTALAMVGIFLGRTNMSPAEMSRWADAHNFAPTGATERAFMTDGAALLGIHSTLIQVSRSSIERSLLAGNPVIAVVRGGGDFTNTGHFIVLKSIDERGMVEVFDPNSPGRSARRWGIVRIVNQTNAAWSFSK